MNGIRLVQLVEADAHFAASLAGPIAAAGFTLAATQASVDAALAAANEPDIVVLDSATAAGAPAEAVRVLLRRWPHVCVIVTGGTPATISHAVAAGARGFLLKPYTPADLVGALRESVESTKLMSHPTPARGHVVAVYSPKGGSGCSTIAVGLAVLSAGRPGSSVALIDLDLQFGDVAVMLDLQTPNSIVDLLGHERLDAALVNDTFVRHASGVRVLAAPPDLARVATIDPVEVVATVEALREHFDLIVCDLWPSLDALTAGVLRVADSAILVTKPEVPALKSMTRFLSARDLEMDMGNAIVVANRVPTKGAPSLDDIERSLGRPVSIAVPSDGLAVVDAINRGIAIVDPRIHTRVQRAYRDLETVVWSTLEPSTTQRVERTLVAV